MKYINDFFNIYIKFIKMGIGDWAQSPIPNPQSPIPNPHLMNLIYILKKSLIYFIK